MHVGDQVPKCNVVVKSGTTSVGAGSAIFSTAPTCTVTATSASTVGTYTITTNAGVLASGTDSITYTNGSIQVIAPNGIGAKIVNAFTPNNGETAPPSAFFTNIPWSVMDITNNPVQNCASGSGDNSDCMQHLIASARGASSATVKCAQIGGGPTALVTASAGTPFTGIVPADGEVNINGNWFTVASYTDATHLVLTTTPTAAQCSTASVSLKLPRTIVHVTNGSTLITWVSGPQFHTMTIANELLQLGFQTSVAKIATLTDDTHITLNTSFSIPNVTGDVPLYIATLTSGGGAGSMPLFLYVPCGQFKFSHAIQSYGAYSVMWGDGQCSEFYLNPNSPDFQTGGGLSLFAVNPVTTNDTFDWYIRNMWFHVGAGNPKAIALTFAPSNYGAVRNVVISSDDGLGLEGLNLGKSFTGPGAFKNVAIYGFPIGISANIPNHNMEGEYVTVEGQTTSGAAITNIAIQLRKTLFVEDGVPAATNTGAQAHLTITDSEVYDNGGPVCFKNSTTSGFPPSVLFVKNVQFHSSCTDTVDDYGTGSLVATTTDVVEQTTGIYQTLFDAGNPHVSLGLPINETPEANDPASSGWGILDPTDVTTWNASLAACTSTTYMLAPGQVPGSGTSNITIPDCVNHIQFFNSMDTPGTTWHAIFTVAGTSTTPLIFEGCPQNQCGLTHTGSRPVVMLDVNTYNYATSPGAGDLYVDDAILGANLNSSGGVTFQASQHVWARALNQEQPSATKVTCLGGTIWIWGYKTEHNGPNLDLEPGCRGEIYGFEFLGDPSVAGVNGTAITINNASFFMTGKAATQCLIPCQFGFGNQFYFWVGETRSGVFQQLAVTNATTTGETRAMNAFFANGAAAPPPTIDTQINSGTLQGGTIQ
jgi:hypothetical protein